MPISHRDLYLFLHEFLTFGMPGAVPVRVVIEYELDGRPGKFVSGVPRRLEEAAKAGAVKDAPTGRRHSLDFASVLWDGELYVMTANQAAVVRCLWEAMESGTHCVQSATLLEAADCESAKLSDVFRGADAWGKLVVEGPVKGTYRLAE